MSRSGFRRNKAIPGIVIKTHGNAVGRIGDFMIVYDIQLVVDSCCHDHKVGCNPVGADPMIADSVGSDGRIGEFSVRSKLHVRRDFCRKVKQGFVGWES